MSGWDVSGRTGGDSAAALTSITLLKCFSSAGERAASPEHLNLLYGKTTAAAQVIVGK